MLQDRISLPFLGQSLKKSRTTILPINFFGRTIFYFILMTLCLLKQKGQETIVLFCRFQVFDFTKKELTVKV